MKAVPAAMAEKPMATKIAGRITPMSRLATNSNTSHSSQTRAVLPHSNL